MEDKKFKKVQDILFCSFHMSKAYLGDASDNIQTCAAMMPASAKHHTRKAHQVPLLNTL
jgi:hypothetical protein